MDQSLVPANSKKAQLIMGMFRLFPDLIIFLTGVAITIILLLVFSDAATWIQILSCLPLLIGILLVFPIPNYHNTLVAIQSILNYYDQRRKYIWRGWCVQNEYREDKK